MKDDRDVLLEKLHGSDGVILATPCYSFQVTALMKNLLDRLAFVHHRPQFNGKDFTSLVTYGIFGGASIVKYLETMGENFGFRVARGCSLMTLGPMTERRQRRNSQKIEKASRRFYQELIRQTPPTPSFFRLLIFRLSRTSLKLVRDKQSRDYCFYKEKGWFESDYYYAVHLGFSKKLAGRFFDFLGQWMVRHR